MMPVHPGVLDSTATSEMREWLQLFASTMGGLARMWTNGTCASARGGVYPQDIAEEWLWDGV